MLRDAWVWFKTPPASLDEEDNNYFTMISFSSLAGFMVHLFLLVLFIALDVKELAYFNIASILIFLGAFISGRMGRITIGLITATMELIIHACYATFIFGLNSGFHFYLFGCVIFWFLLNIPLRMKFLCGFLICLVFTGLLIFAPRECGLEHISGEMINAFEVFNGLTLIVMSMGCCFFYHQAVTHAKRALSKEYERSESLLHNVLPPPIASRLKNNEANIADGFPACSVLFADIVGFTIISQQLAPERLVGMLNDIFSSFDKLAKEHGLEKIKTIGDAYMVASGIPDQDGNHAQNLAEFALDMRESMEQYRKENGFDISIRIGIHSGPAVAGVIGQNKFIYDIWGDTVNTAARMESHGRPGEIHISNLTKELLGTAYHFQDVGENQIKGKGMMRTWLLKSKTAA